MSNFCISERAINGHAGIKPQQKTGLRKTGISLFMAPEVHRVSLIPCFEMEGIRPRYFIDDTRTEFVDCGAFVGDTIELFLTARERQFKKIYAFEPDRRNFCALCNRVERLKQEWAISDGEIELIQAGIGRGQSVITLQGEGSSSAVASNLPTDESFVMAGEECVPLCSIDEHFQNVPITFLKADIEGFEWSLLAGAEKVIRRDKPKLALCIYHSASDMYRIACRIKELRPDYRLAVRQHYCDLPETVLYAW